MVRQWVSKQALKQGFAAFVTAGLADLSALGLKVLAAGSHVVAEAVAGGTVPVIHWAFAQAVSKTDL